MPSAPNYFYEYNLNTSILCLSQDRFFPVTKLKCQVMTLFQSHSLFLHHCNTLINIISSLMKGKQELLILGFGNKFISCLPLNLNLWNLLIDLSPENEDQTWLLLCEAPKRRPTFAMYKQHCVGAVILNHLEMSLICQQNNHAFVRFGLLLIMVSEDSLQLESVLISLFRISSLLFWLLLCSWPSAR